MSLPYHRGHSSNNSAGMHRPNWNSNNNTSPYPGKDRANEVSTTLMELENNQRWVSETVVPTESFLSNSDLPRRNLASKLVY
jgi:hypothetical protein